MFIGRQKELNKIIQRVKGEYKEFIAITGKRGVGKTFTLEKVKEIIPSEIKILEIVGRQGLSKRKQIEQAVENFEKVLGIRFSNNSWNDFFRDLKQFLKENNEVNFLISIDEFHWLNTKGSCFVEDFGAFWNSITTENVKIIITGSAVSWMNKNVFRTKGGLYHKTTLRINLKPFSFEETMKFLLRTNPNLTNFEIVNYYLMTGGNVRYLKQIRNEDTMEVNYNEIYNSSRFDDFFESSFNSVKTNIHKEIVELFKDRIRMSAKDIIQKISKKNMSRGLIYNTINELVETDILTEVKTHKKKNGHEYILTDLFCFNFLRKSSFNSQQHSIINGYAFEILTLLNVDMVLSDLNRGRVEKIECWQSKEAQIDLLVSYPNDLYSIIECKNHREVFEVNIETVQDLMKKTESFYLSKSKRSKVEVILVTMFGTKNRTTYKYIDFCLDDFVDRKRLEF